ncbi:hypothetical protein DSO57_1026480 [Entomophthora muscae]|uniref:Uncharacterized protein n=1 Tax=Entomophthora muscae TaxID=34485 RepID=A0ACC2UBH0_9FUNG|nr:hypothetical protein DSO57_1026480 [Entomophthora muscae]
MKLFISTSLRKAVWKRLFSCSGLLAVPIHSPPLGKSFCLCLPAPGCHYTTTVKKQKQGTVIGAFIVRNENLNVPESQITEPGKNSEQNPFQTARPIGWEPNNPLPIDKVVANSPGPKSLTVTQDSASKLPVKDAGNSPKVPTPDTGSLLGEIHKFLHENYFKLPQSPGGGTEPKEAPNTQINKQKDLKSSHPEAAIAKPPVPNATPPSKTPNANPPELKKPDKKMKPGSAV